MRTVTFGAACSLDGFIARTNHAVDWLRWSKDVNAITRKLWKTIDTVVMGRKTFEVGQEWRWGLSRRQELRLLANLEAG